MCAPRSREAVVGAMVLVVGLTGALAATVFVDEADEAVVAAGLHDDWEQETAVDNVFVDGAGNVWGVRPWDQAEPATISLLDHPSGQFRETADRRPAWPPTVLGSDATGTTWIVSSDIDDPFEPVFENYRDGRFSTVPAPASPLPPLDAVVLDGPRNRLFGLHSDFAVPATLVLETFEGDRWKSAPTPMMTSGRATSVDMAVDATGRVWVWHDADPATVQRYEAGGWTPVGLPFDVETTTNLDALPIAMDAFRTLFADRAGTVWLYDRDGSQLVTVDDAGAVAARRALPSGCVPLDVDGEGRVWCGDGEGLSIVAVDGGVVYDSQDQGVHAFAPVSVAIAADRAWVLVRRGGADQLLTFDHPAALARN